MDSLERAKNDLRQGWKTPDGATCECCGQKVKMYTRKLNSSQAAGLIRLVNLWYANKDWNHVRDISQGKLTVSDFAQVRRWGLAVESINSDDTKRNSGLWKPTAEGINFVFGNLTVPIYCEIYNNKTLGFSVAKMGIKQALGKKFDYTELMGRLL